MARNPRILLRYARSNTVNLFNRANGTLYQVRGHVAVWEKWMFKRLSRYTHVIAVLAIGLAASLVVADVAEARRGGSGFGSRGTRTFQAPPATRTAPTDAAPINRTMTPQQPASPSATPQAAQRPATPQAQRPGFFNGFGRSLMGGLLLGGLFGMLLGQGFGGMAGLFGMLLQVLLIGGGIMLLMRFLANRRQSPMPAGVSARQGAAGTGRPPAFDIPAMGGSSARQPAAAPAAPAVSDMEVGQADLDRFEVMLREVQTAYANEDYAQLRRLTTPEAMSYLAEELSDNATNGLRNVVTDVTLVQGDIAEAWREGTQEYATVAMRYSSIDAMVERSSGRVVSGDLTHPTDTVEVWTFTRRPGTDWLLSAIQST